MTFFVVLGLVLSLTGAQAQPVVVGGSGGWDEFKNSKTTLQLNLLTKKLFRNYGNNLSKCDNEIKPVKIKTWHEFSLSIIKQAISSHKIEVNDSVDEKPCPGKAPEATAPQTISKRNGENCALGPDEIEIIKKLLETNNLKSYLGTKHKMPEQDAEELIELLQHIVAQERKNEVSTQIGQ